MGSEYDAGVEVQMTEIVHVLLSGFRMVAAVHLACVNAGEALITKEMLQEAADVVDQAFDIE